jgi:23S rRNA (cytidine1920-2'-O)/16S rRNA (cytidine1409-2'-O)-methyltransferase
LCWAVLQVKVSDVVEVRAEVPKYVCRGGFKLEAALREFDIHVKGAVALDAGISTGGFTDCLLQHGATRVYGVDVGYGQVAERIRTDSRVTLLERTNVRHLPPDALPEKVDLVTLDLSFISVLKVLPAVLRVCKDNAEVVVLIKPQFEAGPQRVEKGGVVRDAAVHRAVIAEVTEGATTHGLQRKGLVESPLRGAEAGNIEFLAHFVRANSIARELKHNE